MQTEFARNGADIGRQMLTIGICRDGPRNSRDLFQEIRKGSLKGRTFAAVEPVDKNRSTKRAGAVKHHRTGRAAPVIHHNDRSRPSEHELLK